MTVPDFQTIMLPLLKVSGDEKEHTITSASDFLAANIFHLSEEEKKELLPSGIQSRFKNRVGWARTYLAKAGLLKVTGRGKFCITDAGKKILVENPGAINIDYLSRFPSFQEFKNFSKPEKDEKAPVQSHLQTPEESLEYNYNSLRHQLVDDLLEHVKKCEPSFFEQLVVDLLVAMGYGGSLKDAGEAVGQSGDGGIDGIIKEDKLGLDVVFIQAKRWEAVVGRPVVQAFAGSLEGHRAKKGVLITTSQFSKDAKEYVTKIEKKIVLIDGEQLAQLMIDHNIGVTEVSTYTVKKLDLDYFEET